MIKYDDEATEIHVSISLHWKKNKKVKIFLSKYVVYWSQQYCVIFISMPFWKVNCKHQIKVGIKESSELNKDRNLCSKINLMQFN